MHVTFAISVSTDGYIVLLHNEQREKVCVAALRVMLVVGRR